MLMPFVFMWPGVGTYICMHMYVEVVRMYVMKKVV
jgi:hypothetical protein